MPSVEEITAITAGRNAKRVFFRLPGGMEIVLNVKVATIVKVKFFKIFKKNWKKLILLNVLVVLNTQDVIEELCVSHLNITNALAQSEFSVYCIVDSNARKFIKFCSIFQYWSPNRRFFTLNFKKIDKF